MHNQDWNPEFYLKFGKERIQPSLDLVSRITISYPEKIIDIGCGPGNSTQILVRQWPDSDITGIDNSPAMIEKAKNDYPNQNWILMDAGKDAINGKYDIIFSNATIQWIPNHDDLIKKFYHLLNENGILAVQIPLFWDMPLGKSIASIARDPRWESSTGAATALLTIHDGSYYYDILSKQFESIELWETHYYHIMNSQSSILEMIRSTGLKPYLERLESDDARSEFERRVLEEIKKAYPVQADKKVIFPFRRLFFIARKDAVPE